MMEDKVAKSLEASKAFAYEFSGMLSNSPAFQDCRMSLAHAEHSVLLVVKARHPEASALAADIRALLESAGGAVRCVQADETYAALPSYTLVVVLGGDGTVLDAARRFVPNPVPLLGINFGKVGFLAETRSENWREVLESALAGRLLELRRTALAFDLHRSGEKIVSGFAVNDVVINRGSMARVVNLDIAIQSFDLCRIRADGLIVASPQGCSGYAASAGGPLVHPDISALALVPICPFLCNFPPLVLPHPMEAHIRLPNNTTDIHLTVDGQVGYELRTDDEITVRTLPGGVCFARAGREGYFSRLKARGFLTERPTSPHAPGGEHDA